MLKPLTALTPKRLQQTAQQRHFPGESGPCLQRSRGRQRGTGIDRKFVPDDGGTTSSSLGEIEFLVERGRVEDKTEHITQGIWIDMGFTFCLFSLSLNPKTGGNGSNDRTESLFLSAWWDAFWPILGGSLLLWVGSSCQSVGQNQSPQMDG